MVVPALSIGGAAGVLLSVAFLYVEVGRYAAPQVPVTLFDERKELIGYTVGLFAGIPLALLLISYLATLLAGYLLTAIVAGVIFVVGAELAQTLMLRTRYFGAGPARPFYAVALRCGIAAILALALLAGALSEVPLDPLRLLLASSEAVAFLFLGAASGLLSHPAAGRVLRFGGGFGGSAIFFGLGSALVGLSAIPDPITGTVGALLATGGGYGVYRRLRRPVLGSVEPAPRPPEGPTRFGRRPAGPGDGGDGRA